MRAGRTANSRDRPRSGWAFARDIGLPTLGVLGYRSPRAFYNTCRSKSIRIDNNRLTVRTLSSYQTR